MDSSWPFAERRCEHGYETRCPLCSEEGKVTGAAPKIDLPKYAWLVDQDTGEKTLIQEITEQQLKCLRGEHEADAIYTEGRALRYEDEAKTVSVSLKHVVCKHCRCLYVEKV